MVRDKISGTIQDRKISITSLAARHWLIGWIIGIPPPTLASNRKFTFFSWAILKKLRALGGDQLLIGGHHAFSRFQQSLYIIVGRVKPSHDLRYDPDLRIV